MEKEKKSDKRVWFKLAEMTIKYKTAKAKADEYEKRYNRLCDKYWKLYDEAVCYGAAEQPGYSITPD